ncbi:MAG: hypothetical protein MUE70_01725 [Desulfobacterales bacterium]|jgi:hypothetical protein|nr:hypothetical protein [Desulfobacterales bacterium]
MIIRTSNGQTFDTDSDLSAAERHILQKLFAWKSFVQTIKEFQEKKDRSFKSGWNNSGPVAESQAMRMIIQDIEKEVAARLKGIAVSETGACNGP